MEIKFIGGFLDGETRQYSEPIPHRVELWPETEAQRERRQEMFALCTSRDSQIYYLDDSLAEPIFVVNDPGHGQIIFRSSAGRSRGGG
jgi:hypothetical protein